MAEIQSAPAYAPMDNERAVTYLDSLLGRTLRVHTSDTRMFVGEFKCTDRDRNIILGLTHEYRRPTAATVNAEAAAAVAASGTTTIAATTTASSTNVKSSSQDGVSATSTTASQTQAVLRVNMTNRFIGLVVLPGEHIVKIEVEG
ncbi:hypothetical protein KEM56_002264 [Ascosphaera pollenicola]|nr:hypothetical protein KEM56_002264 [Ascosphaera pollenicola]